MIALSRTPATHSQLSAEQAARLPALTALPGAASPLTAASQPGRVPPHAIWQPSSPLAVPATVSGYKVARPALHAMQHKKCAYCEKTIGLKESQVEHFRPKSVYWWLIWDWSNLLLVCGLCNGSKSNYFPLQTSQVLQPPSLSPPIEIPYLFNPADPASPDPLDHIEFKPIPRRRTIQWRPFPRNSSQIGAEWIAAAQLDRNDLLDHYKNHIEFLENSAHLSNLRSAQTQGDPAIQAAWTPLRQFWLSAKQAYSALSRDYLLHTFPTEIARLNLDTTIHP